MAISAEGFLAGTMTLPADARLRIAIRLIESLEVVPDSRQAKGSE